MEPRLKPLQPASFEISQSLRALEQPAPSDHFLTLARWAQKRGHANTLKNLLAAAQVNSLNLVGVPLHFICRPSVSSLLQGWAEFDQCAEDLFTLTESLRAEPLPLSHFPTLPSSKPMGDQFRGTTREHRVTMMLGSYVPGTKPSFMGWFDALRIWVFIQSYNRQTQFKTCDQFVDRVADHIRLSADNSPERLELIAKLSAPVGSVDSISEGLLRSIKWVKETGQPDVQDLMDDLIRLAHGDVSPYTNEGARESLFDGLAYYGATDSNGAKPPADFTFSSIEPDDDDETGLSQLSGTRIFTLDVPGRATNQERLLSGQGILLRTAEGLQFLPWSAQKPSPLEREALWEALHTWANSDEPRIQTLAWMTWVAVLSSRSLRLTPDIEVSDSTVDEWRISSDLSRLHRLPPRRTIHWSAKDTPPGWIQDLQPDIRVDISRLSIDRDHTEKIQKLSDLWQRVSPHETAESLFNSLCAKSEELRRLKSGLLSEILPQAIFENCNDGVLAQLVSMRKRTGLGGNSAYASFSGSVVTKNFTASFPNFSIAGGENSNAAGSELAPLDEALSIQIQAAWNKLNDLSNQPENWIHFHNCITTYVVTALLAATGARPVSDPFQSPQHIDWVTTRIFLSDKTSIEGLGRLVPLPRRALGLCLAYLNYLFHLADAVKNLTPALATEILLLANRQESKHLPFFFYLRPKPVLSWASVTERSLREVGLLEWPLPLNLFRHRLSLRSREAGLDPELIDSILGHSDSGVQTHGDESPRIWLNDMVTVQPILESAYAALGFSETLPMLPPNLPVDKLRVNIAEMFPQNKTFGSVARAKARKASLRNSLLEAKRIIRAVMRGVGSKGMQQTDWDQLAIKLTTLDGARLHPYAEQRYGLLDRWQSMQVSRKKIHIRKAFVLDKQARPIFSDQCIGVQQTVAQYCEWLELVIARTPRSKLSMRHRLALAAYDLLLNCRISSMSILMDVIAIKNVRLVQFDGKAYLEHHPLLDKFPQAPVRRFRVSRRAFNWITDARTSKYSVDVTNLPLPESWVSDIPHRDIFNPKNLSQHYRQLRSYVEQCNYIDRPGLICGYLSGRVIFTALPHDAWLLQNGLIRTSKLGTENGDQGAETNDDPTADADSVHGKKPFAKFVSCSSDIRLEAATQVHAAFNEEIRKYIDGPNSNAKNDNKGNKGENDTPDDQNKPGPEDISKINNARRDLRRDLTGILEKHTPKLSSATWMLFQWIIALSNKKRSANEFYSPRTLQRYLSSIGQRLIGVGYDFDLRSADAEETTDFYVQVLDNNREIDLHYVGERLQQFHVFLQQEFSLEEPMWDEIDVGNPMPHGSPGTLGLFQYLNALECICFEAHSAPHINLARAVLLLLAFRFGLRGDDSHGLLLSDIWDYQGMIVIAVRPNQLRSLKRRKSGRRLIPLLETLTDLERQIFDQFLIFARTYAKEHINTPVFTADATGSRFDLANLRTNVNDILKLVCKDQNVTLHKARHAYANRVCALVMQRELDANVNQQLSDNAQHVRILLLQTTHSTRRAPWALCRLLGHSRPSVSFKSYVHEVSVWSDSWNSSVLDRLDLQHSPAEGDAVASLDRSATSPWEPLRLQMPITMAKGHWNLAKSIEYLDLIRSGASPGAAKRAISIHPVLASNIDKAIAKATDTISARAVTKEGDQFINVLFQIGDQEWRGIVSLGKESSQVPTAPLFDPATAMEEGLSLVSANRQILAWQQKHFAWLNLFIQRFPALADCVALNDSTGKHETVQSWIETHNLVPLRSNSLNRTRPDLPVAGDPPNPVRPRCALQIKSDSKGPVISSYGLVALWVVFICCDTAHDLDW